MMRDRNFRNTETLPIRERGQIAMKFSINLQAFRHFLAISFQAAIKIVQTNSAEKAGDRIEKFAWPSLAHRIVTLLFPTADKIIALRELGYKVGKFARVVLQIGIHCNNDSVLRF